MSENEPLTRGVEATVTVSWLPEPFAGWVAVCVTLWRSPGKEDDAGLDYGFLQWAIGVIAAVLPLGVVIFTWAHGNRWALEDSISHYYYTAGRDWFVGSLCALAVFFFSYRRGATGKYRIDAMLSNFSAAMALGVAFCPTTFDDQAKGADAFVGTVHLVCATLLFTALGVFAMFLFSRSGGTKTPQKQKRNTVYHWCGAVIFACIAILALSEALHWTSGPKLYWYETVMVEAFAVSWLIKGGFLGLLADPTPATPLDGAVLRPGAAPSDS